MTQINESEPALITATRLLVPSSDISSESGTEAVENRHPGWMVLADLHQGCLHCTPGAANLSTFFRSSAKPFQAYPLVEAGYALALSPAELALCCASHSGSPQHLALAQSILKKAGLDETALQCGPHVPADLESQQLLAQSGQSPGPLHNNCSGKHAGMLLYCRQAGLDTHTYLDPAHALQQRILAVLQTWSQVRDIPVAIDGCGAPVFYLPLWAMARLYAQLGSAPEFAPLVDAMTSHPEVVGGTGRVDTVLMQVSHGKLLAKVGADGVIGISRVGARQGLAVKIADGSNEMRNLAVVETLIRLGWLSPKEAADPRLAPYRDVRRLNTQGKTIGHYRVHVQPRSWPHQPLP